VGDAARLPQVRAGPWVLAVLPVDVDAVTSPEVAHDLHSLLAPDVSVLVVDMSGAGFCDSSGVRMLLLVHRQAQAQSCELRLVVPTSGVRRVLGLMGADRVLRVFATMGEALADAPGPVRAREVKTGD
jgi:anti-sigma B factor antagonist